jgi:dUTP pyrophosphatase
MHIKIKSANEMIKAMYINHGHFHEGDAGLDLFTPSRIVCPAKATTKIDLGIKCEPVGVKAYYLWPRSSISKTPLRLANSIGLIDSSYRGSIIAVVDNNSDNDYVVELGERLFQIVDPSCNGITMELVDELSETTRGEGGFGSTGK